MEGYFESQRVDSRGEQILYEVTCQTEEYTRYLFKKAFYLAFDFFISCFVHIHHSTTTLANYLTSLQAKNSVKMSRSSQILATLHD